MIRESIPLSFGEAPKFNPTKPLSGLALRLLAVGALKPTKVHEIGLSSVTRDPAARP